MSNYTPNPHHGLHPPNPLPGHHHQGGQHPPTVGPPINTSQTPAMVPNTLLPAFQSAVLVFLKGLSAPIVLYSDHPAQLYEEIRVIIKTANHSSPKLMEKPGAGPLKKVSFLDTEVSGVALQSEAPPAHTATSANR
jgi:hypothetical protein